MAAEKSRLADEKMQIDDGDEQELPSPAKKKGLKAKAKRGKAQDGLADNVDYVALYEKSQRTGRRH
jgi:hypothetical protein